MAKLPNAPLQEVIFEIRWLLQHAEGSDMLQDPEFELAKGRLSTILEKELPVHKRIPPSEIPEQLLFYRPVYQYWKGEKIWPVVQLGPGIFTVNCTDDWYDWDENYFPFLQKAIHWLIQAYKKPIQFAFASLRYIDAIKVEKYGGMDEGWRKFISKWFNFTYDNSFNTRGSEKQIQINQVFEMEDGSSLQIQLSEGKQNNETALVWQTAVQRKQSFTEDQLIEWVVKAHDTTHELFKDMIKPELYASFTGKNKN
jgi:uncharacterized protein (TIGR04255 family)